MSRKWRRRQRFGKGVDAGPRSAPRCFDREWPLRVGDIDRDGRLSLDAACRHIQDIGQDQLREMGHEETHLLWIVRRTMVDLIRPIEFQDMLRMRRWCSGTSNRWCEMRVRIDGRKGRPDRIRGVLDQHQPGRPRPGPHLRRLHGGPAAHHRCRPAALEGLPDRRLPRGRQRDPDFPIRVSDIDLFDHVNNSVYWKVVEEFPWPTTPSFRGATAGDHRTRSAGGVRRQAGDPAARVPAGNDRQVRSGTGRSHC